jgi:hypothetical protein
MYNEGATPKTTENNSSVKISLNNKRRHFTSEGVTG